MAIALYDLSADYGRLRYGHLRTQLMKAVDSVATNIAEGCGTDSNREFARFLDISIKSASETENHLISARDLELMSQENWLRCTRETIEIRRMTFGYRKRVLEDDPWWRRPALWRPLLKAPAQGSGSRLWLKALAQGSGSRLWLKPGREQEL